MDYMIMFYIGLLLGGTAGFLLATSLCTTKGDKGESATGFGPQG
ncbi:MAG: hypothetical protein ACPGU7_10990 [Gammaproteobacteria bacterium]